MKKSVIMLLGTFLLILTITGCGGSSGGDTETSVPSDKETVEEEKDTAGLEGLPAIPTIPDSN